MLTDALRQAGALHRRAAGGAVQAGDVPLLTAVAGAAMRIAVIGAGGVGGYFGASSRCGNDVTFVARGAHLDAIRRDGLRVANAATPMHVAERVQSDPAAIRVDVGRGRTWRCEHRACSTIFVAQRRNSPTARRAEIGKSSMLNDVIGRHRLEALARSRRRARIGHVGSDRARLRRRYALRGAQALRCRRGALTVADDGGGSSISSWSRLINALALLARPVCLPARCRATPSWRALIAALVLGLINTLIRPILDPAHAAGRRCSRSACSSSSSTASCSGRSARSSTASTSSGFWAGVLRRDRLQHHLVAAVALLLPRKQGSNATRARRR